MGYCARCGNTMDAPVCRVCGWAEGGALTATPAPSKRPLLVAGAGAVVLLLLVVVGVFGWRQGWFGGAETAGAGTTSAAGGGTSGTSSGGGQASAAAPSPRVAPSPSPTPSPTPPSPEQLRATAIDTLEAMVVNDRARNPIRGQWVAQLASKYEGVSDPLQQSTPFTVPQILDEVNRLRSNPDYGSLVRVVHQGDWGNSTAGPLTMWVTFADIDYPSKADVQAWCEARFTQRGDELSDVCDPRQMTVK